MILSECFNGNLILDMQSLRCLLGVGSHADVPAPGSAFMK